MTIFTGAPSCQITPILYIRFVHTTWWSSIKWFSETTEEVLHLPHHRLLERQHSPMANQPVFPESSSSYRPALSTVPKNPTSPEPWARYHPDTCLTQVYPVHLSKCALISAWDPGDGTGTTCNLFTSTC